MRYELNNQSVRLVEAFKKEAQPVVQTAGSGRKPPSIFTAVAMREPEENRTPIPAAFHMAMENNEYLEWTKDLSYADYEKRLDQMLFLALDLIDPQDLPGLDEVLIKYGDLITENAPKPSKRGLDKFLAKCI